MHVGSSERPSSSPLRPQGPDPVPSSLLSHRKTDPSADRSPVGPTWIVLTRGSASSGGGIRARPMKTRVPSVSGKRQHGVCGNAHGTPEESAHGPPEQPSHWPASALGDEPGPVPSWREVVRPDPRSAAVTRAQGGEGPSLSVAGRHLTRVATRSRPEAGRLEQDLEMGFLP